MGVPGVIMGERRRKLVFAGAAAVLLGITLVLTLRESGPAHRRDARRERRADQSAIRPDPPTGPESGVIGDARESTTPAPAEPSTMPTPASAPRHEGEARNAPAIAPGEAHAAAAAACAFLEGYLPYSYGRADAERIRAAAMPLLRGLEAAPPRCRRASPPLARSSSPCGRRRQPAVQTSTPWPWSRMAGGGTASRSRCGTPAAAGS